MDAATDFTYSLHVFWGDDRTRLWSKKLSLAVARTGLISQIGEAFDLYYVSA
jgi:hypothetical protein